MGKKHPQSFAAGTVIKLAVISLVIIAPIFMVDLLFLT